MNIINLLRLFLVCLVFSSCKKSFLDTNLNVQLTDEEIRTNRGVLWNTGYGMYAGFRSGFSMIDGNLVSGITDEAQQTSLTGDVYSFTRGLISQDVNPLEGRYEELYEGIRGALYFLDFIKDGRGMEQLKFGRDTITGQISYERDKENLSYFIAESYIVQAYYYGELIKMYGGVPIIHNLFQDNPDDLGKVPRSDYEDVVEYIVDLIDGHIDDLQDDWKSSSDFAQEMGRMDKLTALAIKARVLLYAASPLNNPGNDIEKWMRAAKAAQDVLEKKNYQLPENRDYQSAFIGNNPVSSEGNIFVIRRPDDNEMEIRNYPISTIGGQSGLTPSHNLVSAYEYVGDPDPHDPYANRDPRLKSSVVVNGSQWNDRIIDESPGGVDDMKNTNASRTGYYLRKFLHENLNLIQGGTTQHQWIVYRFAEIYLNYAEAMNEAFGPNAVPSGFDLSAKDALMMVRNSASTDLPEISTFNKDVFREAVKHERRIELAFEGHRYWDLLRWRDAVNVLNQPIKGVKVSRANNGDFIYSEYEVEKRAFEEKNYHLPFSRSEITNSNGWLIQNEGF